MKLRCALTLLFAALAPCSMQVAHAQEFPTRPITMVMGIAAGGIMDTAGRIYAEVVGRILGQNIVIENRSGGGASIAANAVQSAAPDGYTILLLSGVQHAAIPHMQRVSYDAVKGLAPITVLFDSAAILTVPATSPAKNLAEFFKFAKSKPNGVLFATPGVAAPPHLLAARIAAATNTPMQFVHYRGSGPVMGDLVAGRVDAAFPSYPAASGFFSDKSLIPLAVEAERRLNVLPDVPTLKEVGLGEQKVASWFGIAAPAATPPAIIEKLRAAFVKASEDPVLIRRLDELGIIVHTSTSAEMGKLMEDEWNLMKTVIPSLGLQKQ